MTFWKMKLELKLKLCRKKNHAGSVFFDHFCTIIQLFFKHETN